MIKAAIFCKAARARNPQVAFSAPWSLLSILLVLVVSPWQCASYRVGDTVDTIIRTPEETADALSNQMPLFGVPSVEVFFESPARFSLAFQEGLRPLPWVELQDSRKRALEEVIVTFVYSRSGDGTIHSISSQPKYKDTTRESGNQGFRVRYEWVEEETVDLRSGLAFMLLAVSIASIAILIQSCTDPSQGENASSGNSASYDSYGDQINVASGAGKWD